MTEVDRYGADQHSPGSKLDLGKVQMRFLQQFGKALRAVAEVAEKGAAKYTECGWRKVPDGVNRYTDAMLRHYFDEFDEDYDKDHGTLHAAQTAWNALARLELMLMERDNAAVRSFDGCGKISCGVVPIPAKGASDREGCKVQNVSSTPSFIPGVVEIAKM